ncbi:MAG TPA: hypothetical protein VFZ72_12460 [Jiangellaceae bacterium]
MSEALSFEESAICRAPAIEVWKLLHDPIRFTEWWAGVTRIEPTADGVAMYTGGAPIPTRVTAGPSGSSVVINCLASEDVFVWTLTPHPDGCHVTARVEVSDGDEKRLSSRRDMIVASLPRLVAAAELRS